MLYRSRGDETHFSFRSTMGFRLLLPTALNPLGAGSVKGAGFYSYHLSTQAPGVTGQLMRKSAFRLTAYNSASTPTGPIRTDLYMYTTLVPSRYLLQVQPNSRQIAQTERLANRLACAFREPHRNRHTSAGFPSAEDACK